MHGKYETILKTFSTPADKDRYGDLYDLGYQNRTTYGTNRNLPAGYWVYAYPYWYIWKTKADDSEASLDYGKASVRGKYETILKTFSAPGDKDRYGELNDLGYQDRTTYGTNRNLPAGYWVYSYPYWYIWKTKADDTGASLDYGKASVRGKYETILKTFSVPADKDRYGNLYDLGYQDKATYGTNRNLPSGYWVYAYPYWYIWKTESGETGGSLDYTKASVKGKYETILKTFSTPADRDRYGDLYDLGYQDRTTYGTNRNLPAGYWVYAYPYWYIWKTKTGRYGSLTGLPQGLRQGQIRDDPQDLLGSRRQGQIRGSLRSRVSGQDHLRQKQEPSLRLLGLCLPLLVHLGGYEGLTRSGTGANPRPDA